MTPDIGRFGPPAIEQSPDHQALAALLLDQSPPFGIDWQAPAHELRLPERLMRLAGLKAILEPDNAEKEQVTHDKTLENYIRLALHSAGDRATLDTFLNHIEATLDTDHEAARFLAQQVFWIWAPAAEIADLHEHKARLEDTALRVLEPEDYAQLERDYQAIDLERGLLRDTRAEIEELIDSLDIKEPFSYELKHRAKSKYSAWRKMQLERRSDAQVFDLMGFRVVIDGGDESMAVGQLRYILAAMEDYFESSPEWRKDYITNPKPTGYRSLHQTFTLPNGQSFELQLRTRSMQDQAKAGGQLTHQAYDATNKVVPGKIRRNFKKVPRIYRWRDQASLYMQEHGGRTDGILDEQVLFFKDNGNLYLMPAGATALDASYTVHSRRALKTWAVNRNGRPMELSDKVEHGDVLGIRYHDRYPTKDEASRLDRHRIAMTTDSGKNAIKRYKRSLESDELRTAGRLIIAAMLPELDTKDPTAVLSDKDRSLLAQKAGLPSFDKLLEIIGDHQKSGKPSRIANLIRVRSGLPLNLKKNRIDTEMPLSDQQVLERIVLPNRDVSPVCNVAGCCSGEIHLGDNVIARPSGHHYATMQLHRTDCNNVATLEGTIACLWPE
jgi:(p)ppGpp synthase/HD superfamily hydrolase